MVDYTKYVLKSTEELEGLLAGKDNFFVVACNKCYKEFDTTEEPECGNFAAIAQAQGKHITGTAKVDFLCNKVQTEKKLAGIVPEGTENVVVISLNGFSIGTNFSAVLACFNNIGPGLEAVGPTCNYAAYSVTSKLVLILDMLAGRLEIFPILVLFSRSTWKQH